MMETEFHPKEGDPMSEQNQSPHNVHRRADSTPRPRKSPRRPKWVKNKLTYQIWRNWPLIRFVLVCVILLSILCGMVSCAVGATSVVAWLQRE